MSSRLKTLYICPNGYLGGAEKALINFCAGHKDTKWPAEIMFFSDGEAVKAAQSKGIKIHILPVSFKLSSPMQLLKACHYLRNYIRRNDFKIVHSTMAYSQIVVTLSTIFMHIKRVWYQHGPVQGFLDKIAIRTPVDQIYFNSNYLKRLHNTNYLISAPKYKEHIVPCAIEIPDTSISKVENIREKYKQDDEIIFLIAGRITRCKAYENAIHALSQISTTQWKLLIVGSAMKESDQQYEQELHTLVIELKLEDKITFISFQSDISNYFKAADIFLHTSNFPEPFGLVVAEAMLQSCFVIGSSQGGVADFLIHKKTGYSYDSTAQNAISLLKETIEQVLRLNHHEVAKITEKSSQLISTQYSIIKIAQQLEELYAHE